MIYELSLVAKSNLTPEIVSSLVEMVDKVVTSFEGKVFISDDWGVKNFAQPTSKGVESGHYLYFMFQANNENNTELLRRLKINESVLKSMVVKLSDLDEDGEKFAKEYKSPFSKKYSGSATDNDDVKESEKERKIFTKRRRCWFTANKIKADWKDPATFTWLINEFGKISPARVSGISRKHQRYSCLAVKRARQLGLISHMSNRIAE